MTLTEQERQAVERGNARGCLMCRRIVEAWLPSVTMMDLRDLRDWHDEVVTFGVDAQKFHVSQEMKPWE